MIKWDADQISKIEEKVMMFVESISTKLEGISYIFMRVDELYFRIFDFMKGIKEYLKNEMKAIILYYTFKANEELLGKTTWIR